jgi:hypothetical protein
MNRFLLLAALGLITVSSTDSHAQSRDLGARRLILDDGAAGRLTISYAGPGSGTLVIQPGSSVPIAGTTASSTLRWNGSNWIENVALLASSTGATLNTAGGADLTIAEGGLTRAGSIAINTGTSNILSTDGSLAVTGAGRSGTPVEGFHAGADGLGTTGIEIVEATASPYIDFTRNPGNDFDGRLILNANDNLRVEGTNLDMAGNSFIGASSINAGLITSTLHVNAANGYQVAGAAASGQYLRGNGTHFVSSAIQAADLPSGSSSYIQNGVAQQTADFNITGDGTIGDDLTVNGAINLPATTTTDGYINLGGSRFMHGNSGTFLGSGSGNLSSTGAANVGIGASSLANATSGIANTAVGNGALTANTSGGFNTAIGYTSMGANLTGLGNTAIGSGTLASSTAAGFNTAVGYTSQLLNLSGLANTSIGSASLKNNTTGTANTAVGYLALVSALSDENTAVGYGALSVLTTGTQNTAVGLNADVSSPILNNTSSFGYGAVATANNQVVLGNVSVTEVLTRGNLNAPSASLTRLNTSAGGGDKFAGVITTDDASADAIETFANSQITAASTVITTLSSNLGATQLLNAVPGAGSVTITFSANVPDGSKISYMIVNP